MTQLQSGLQCGDGVVTTPEDCDHGTNPDTNVSLNGFGRGCSIGCTYWNLPSCKQAGTCFVPPPPPPRGEDMPGKQEVGSTQLSAWIKIADVNFDDLFQAQDQPTAGEPSTCVHCPPKTTISTCPGALKKFLHPSSRRFFCGAPMTTTYSTAVSDDSMLRATCPCTQRYPCSGSMLAGHLLTPSPSFSGATELLHCFAEKLDGSRF